MIKVGKTGGVVGKLVFLEFLCLDLFKFISTFKGIEHINELVEQSIKNLQNWDSSYMQNGMIKILGKIKLDSFLRIDYA